MPKVFSDRGVRLDATFSVEIVDGDVNLVFESRSGPHGKSKARNTDYIPGLEMLLKRLGVLGARLLCPFLRPVPFSAGRLPPFLRGAIAYI